MAGESEALAAELKARKEARDCEAMDFDLYSKIDLLGGRAFMAQNKTLGKEIGRKVEQIKSLYLTDRARFEKEANALLNQYGQDAVQKGSLGNSRVLAKEVGNFKIYKTTTPGASGYFEVTGSKDGDTYSFASFSEAESFIRRQGQQFAKDAADPAEKKRKLEKEIKDAEKTLETLISPAGRKALSTDLYEMRKELKAMGQDAQDSEDDDAIYSISWINPKWDSATSTPRRRGIKGKKAAKEEVAKLKQEGMEQVTMSLN